MKTSESDRRVSHRHSFKIPLRVRIWKSAEPEQRTESLNLSQNGVYFATDSPVREGETLEILLKMPEEITDAPTTDWQWGQLGVGVQFDCYEISLSKPTVAT